MEWHDCWDIECGLFLYFHELLLFILKTIVECQIIPELKVENWRFMTFCDGLRLTYCQKGWGTPRKCHILGSPLPQKCQVDHMMSLGSLRTICRVSSSAVKRPIGFKIGFHNYGEAPTRAFSLLKAPTSAFTFKTLLRHYAKRALTPR